MSVISAPSQRPAWQHSRIVLRAACVIAALICVALIVIATQSSSGRVGGPRTLPASNAAHRHAPTVVIGHKTAGLF